MQKLISHLSILGFLAGICLSWQLWFPEHRTFPLLPILNSPGETFSKFSSAFGLLIVASAILNLLFPLRKWAVSCLIFTIFLAVLADLTRLQTWVWFYVLLFSVLFFHDEKTEKQTNSAHLLLFCGIYLWGGLFKLNPYFSESIAPWFFGAFSWTKFFADKNWLAWLAAAGEMSFAVGLFFQKTRPVFRWLAIAMHLYIMLTISPLGLNWNLVAIPWNLAMVGILFLVGDARHPIFFKNRMSVLVAILAIVAPALHVFRLWPENLSWKMYSGTHGEFTFYFSGGLKMDLPPNVSNQIFGEAEKNILLDDWTFAELKTPPFDVILTEKMLAEKFCNCVENGDSAGYFLMKVGLWSKSNESFVKIPCVKK